MKRRQTTPSPPLSKCGSFSRSSTSAAWTFGGFVIVYSPFLTSSLRLSGSKLQCSDLNTAEEPWDSWSNSPAYLAPFVFTSAWKKRENIPLFTTLSLIGATEQAFSSVPCSRPPRSLAGCVCGMWFGSVPKDYSERQNKDPQCALFSTFLGPDISPAAGKTQPQSLNGCVREGGPPLDPGSLAGGPRQGGSPRHYWQQEHPLPQQCNQRDALHTTWCFAV